VDRALGRNADVAVQSADQELADLAGTPMGLVALGRDDQAPDLPRQLVGVANRPARAVGPGLETVFLVVALGSSRQFHHAENLVLRNSRVFPAVSGCDGLGQISRPALVDVCGLREARTKHANLSRKI
jgi:hypothetical protein